VTRSMDHAIPQCTTEKRTRTMLRVHPFSGGVPLKWRTLAHSSPSPLVGEGRGGGASVSWLPTSTLTLSRPLRFALHRPLILLLALVALAFGASRAGSAAEDEEPEMEEPTSEEDEKLPTIDQMELPSFQRLMKGPAIDWVVMHSKKVIECEPVYPRPGALEDIDKRVKQALRKSGDAPETETAKRKRMALYYLPVTLLEGEEREYRLHVQFIKEIVYYDDMMLRRIDQLLDDRHVRQAYELLTALEQRHEVFPGVDSRKQRVMFTEAGLRLNEHQAQHALALLEALFERNAAYNGLEVEFGKVAGALMTTSIGAGDPREARYFLRRLARRYPNHNVVKDWTVRLTQETRDLVQKAVAAERAGQPETGLDLVEQATRTWPDLPEVLPVYNRLAGRYQRLRVGVVDLPETVLPGKANSAAPVVLAAAGRRYRQLTQSPLFEPARFEHKTVRYESKFFDEWDPTQLGHSVLFRLRHWRAGWASQPMLRSAGLFGTLRRRLDPQDSFYDARFAAAVEALEVRSPFDLAVRFRQVPLRPESLFAFPLPPNMATDEVEFDGSSAAGEATTVAATWPFELKSVDGRRAVYRRTVAEPDETSDRHVAEMVEIKYPTHEKAIQGLLRGEVSLLPRVPASTVPALAARPDFSKQTNAVPTTHLLQFNPRSRALSARTLRRALVYAIDRRGILEGIFLHGSSGAARSMGRLTSAPFATTSYAYNRAREVEPHQFDPALAYSLAKTAEKELGTKIPVLRLLSSSDPEIVAAAERIIEHWKVAGIEVTRSFAETAALSETGADEWDILYRTECLAEPLVDLWQFLALTNSTETGALGHLPTWLRHELLSLDRVGDWQSARDILQRLHKEFWAEVHLIPLWEIDDVMIVRKNVHGFPDQPMSPYQRVERWKVEPWFTKEPPQ
jgi:hypothetical protein